MKKILFVSTCYPSGEYPQYCIFLEQQAQALKSLGNIVDILVPTSDGTPKSSLRSHKWNSLTVYNINYKTLRYNMFLDITTNSFNSQLKKLLVENKYDVVSVHLAPDWMLKDLILLSKKMSFRVVQHYHGLNIWSEYYSKYPLISKFSAYKRKILLENVDGVVGVSDRVCNLVRSRVNNKNIFTVFNGADVEKFKPKRRTDGNKFKVTCVANLIPIKGQKYLIEAISKLVSKLDNKKIILDIIGRGKDELFLKNEVQRLNMEKYVRFHGYIPYEEVARLISDSDAFVLPSFFDACPCVCLEAMACSVPVISCKNQGTAEITIDGENGLLIEEKNSDSIVEKLSLLLNDEELRKKIGENGYLTIKDNYTWEHSALKLDRIYDNILQ